MIPIEYTAKGLKILDQRKLPSEEVYLYLKTREDIWEGIFHLKVRGAPAIGIAAAYGIYILMKGGEDSSYDEMLKRFRREKDYLLSARPTAVNLSWALAKMEKVLLAMGNGICYEPPWHIEREIILDELLKMAHTIWKEDVESGESMGKHGLKLLKDGMSILTHCNAGALATSKYGTALSPIYLGKEKGYTFHMFVDETRPLLQGARLTAWELMEAGVDATLICDNMAATVLAQGKVDCIIVGCDRMAANGDGANKIGTKGLAILAKEFNIPFYMVLPTSTIDLSLAKGEEITIEERAGEEITSLWYEKRMAPEGIKTFNPAFDVTESEYITAIITEKGVIRPPFEPKLKEIMR